MTRTPFRRLLIISLLGLFLLIPTVGQAQDEPAVRAVLFYSPTCPHCHQVINDVLIPMVEEYGERLQIVAIDVTQAGGQVLYQAAIENFEIPEERLGVPTLVVNDLVLVGSTEIPDQLPGIVREGLASGIDWPAIPGFVPPVESGEPTAQATMAATSTTVASPPATATEIAATATVTLGNTETTPPTPEMEPTTVALAEEDSAPLILDSSQQEIASDDGEDPPADPVGFALATAILIVMVLACAYVAWRLLVPVAGRNRPVG